MFVSKSERRFEYLHLKVHQYTANYLGFSFGLSISKKWSWPISFFTWNTKEILYKRQTISRRSRYVNKIVHSIFRSVAYLNSPCCRRAVRLFRMKDTGRLKLSHLYRPSMVWSWSPQSTKTQMNRNRKQKLKKFVNKYVQDYKYIKEPYFFNRITPKVCYFFMSYINIMHKKRWSNILFR